VTLVVIALLFGLNPWLPSPVLGQTPPAYPELYRDPPRTDQLTPADLPNLGRQVILEATSMFVHARTELADSPESFRLLDPIMTLWNVAPQPSPRSQQARQLWPARWCIPI